MRMGIGFDVHELVENRNLVLGGVEIPHEKGLLGHSDADVLIHAIMDAMLGACALGDIGKHFPDTDNQYKNISSLLLLKNVQQLIKEKGYSINNIDTVIMAQQPKIAPYIEKIQNNIATILEMNKNNISIKATTTEGLGFVGREEGIAAQAVVTLMNNE